VGPKLIIDKSAVENLSRAELDMLDRYFQVIIPTIFPLEVLGDVAKEHRRGQKASAEQRVAFLAGAVGLKLLTRKSLSGGSLLNALSRSRHFGATESDIGRDSDPSGAACRSLFSRQRTGPLGSAVANPSDYTPFRRETRNVNRGACVNRERISSSRVRRVAPHSVGCANCSQVRN
jgi:hypothetical protein